MAASITLLNVIVVISFLLLIFSPFFQGFVFAVDHENDNVETKNANWKANHDDNKMTAIKDSHKDDGYLFTEEEKEQELRIKALIERIEKDMMVNLENSNDDLRSPCDDRCVQPFTSYGKELRPLELECDTASGDYPYVSPNTYKHLKLPLTFPGNYELCLYSFHKVAHFCTIDTDLIKGGLFILPFPPKEEDEKLLAAITKKLPIWLVGPLHIGKCMPKSCSAIDLRKHFLARVDAIANSVASLIAPTNILVKFTALYLKKMLHEKTVVRCVDESEKLDEKDGKDGGYYFWLVLFFGLIVLVLAGSFYHIAYLPTKTLDWHPQTLGGELLFSFSAIHNTSRLLSDITGDFKSLNGIRVISMFWIIYGHTVIIAGGITTYSTNPNINPSALDRQAISFKMIYIRSAEYAVDTFFFMSGFLATIGMIDLIKSSKRGTLTLPNYLYGIVLRYIRLTPTYAFVLLFIVKVVSFTGTGPFWNGALGRQSHFVESCSKYWWTNILYLNNFIPEDGAGVGSCMPWSWYLGNDMMYFLLVGPFTALFLYVQKQQQSHYIYRFFQLYGPCIVLVVIQIISTAVITHEHDIKSMQSADYETDIYIKPWTRVTPYAIGMILAMHHTERVRLSAIQDDSSNSIVSGGEIKKESWRLLHPNKYVVLSTMAFGLILMIVIFVVVFDEYRCKAEPEIDCRVWNAFFLYGLFASPNWADNEALRIFYFSFSFLIYSIAFAALVYPIFCGYGGVVNQFLSHHFWTPFARLTYNAYMVHMMIMTMVYSRAPAFTYFSETRYNIEAISFIVISYIVGYILFILIEKPVMNLSTLFQSRSKLHSALRKEVSPSSGQEIQHDGNNSNNNNNNNNNATNDNSNNNNNNSRVGLLRTRRTTSELHQDLSKHSDVDSETFLILGSKRQQQQQQPYSSSAATIPIGLNSTQADQDHYHRMA